MRDYKEIASRIADDFGANATYVEDLLRQFQHNPKSVDEEWGEYFESLLGGDDSVKVESWSGAAPEQAATAVRPAPAAATAPAAAPRPTPPAASAAETAAGERIQIRGPALKIVENMESSLAVPTATSARQIQIKVLDENRRWVNRHLEAQGGGKTSYTHFVAWAMVKALEKYPQMNDGFEEVDGVAYRARRQDVNLGVAVDVQKKDGTRTLLVPNIKAANRMSFKQFVEAYQDVVKRARDGKLQVADFQGTTISLTNPGTIGTAASTPRLMAGQGAIIATGAIEYPPEYAAMTEEALSQLGISKVFTITSTYDHRIIQGAESGLFLAYIHELLLGRHNFYDEIFADTGITYKPLRWSVDVNPFLSGVDREQQEIKKQARIFEFINAYRVRGHMIADIDPLNMVPIHEHPELEAETYGFSIWDLDRKFFTNGLGGKDEATFREIWAMLIKYYCGKVGIESRHIQSKEQKQWIRDRVERDPEPIPPEVKKQLLQKLIAAEQFEKFLHTKYLGQKRFSVEGGESIIPILDQLILWAAERGVEEVVMGMAHRGRLTVLANVLGNFSERIFTSFEGTVHPNFPADEGDVKYHQGAMADRESGARGVKLTLSPNPSHLEFVDPVVEGMVRAKQDALQVGKEEARARVLPVLIHGDAAFAGQGVVTETLNLADLKGYRTGGTIHFIINNQIGFTTSPSAGRSSIYSTDVAKTTQLPIFHVNADDTEAAWRVLQIALDFRTKFNKDVVIDLIGFRRHGHNEADEPSYTQPLMYQRVREHPGVREIYTRQLIREGVVTQEEVNQMIEMLWRRYENAMLGAKEIVARQKEVTKLPEPKPEADGSKIVETGVSREALDEISRVMSVVPQGFNLNPKMVGQMSRRAKMGSGEIPVDWAFAEGLAFGSLVMEGTSVRLSGQDSGRGTFSQRHAVMYDTRTGEPWVPLAELGHNGARFEIFDSSLSEAAVLGFEYGYSVIARGGLTLWEAQFGDFANGAQVIIDQFIAPSEDKWQQTSGLTSLLPHGYEGQGPEHSSARLERFLQLCAEDNMQVCYPTTPAQYFHLLRRQAKQARRKPLFVMTPKSLLRLPQASSSLDHLTQDGFYPIIGDTVAPGDVARVIVCSGKVYYDLTAEHEKSGNGRVAILRLEQFYPFPRTLLQQWLNAYTKAGEIIWAQEEPQNMGGWNFMRPRLEALAEGRMKVRYVGRARSASPATGSYTIHQLEQAQLVKEALSL
ncbi:MAG TPA: multifunctional oxoglutarate decarboxylase/oxoglutarate dehydrogenase thiamine pyrophosphate-binding subunit/dihydrolipoyllysine-residue succinyltransferase subunit [Blastocatellia bacterium]|jgi:2-oxoglutarate dehydrogenase E1 component|nr:multifunctional oxoglutarate decarboxylase/oxoglutarate dehydrogenase thiamine pyrophosphate-binding subunit/dihydrolipoyllysine-residue succinyltransferase subunit [Blastocatellia bacterium]